jgi:hypothetical protein
MIPETLPLHQQTKRKNKYLLEFVTKISIKALICSMEGLKHLSRNSKFLDPRALTGPCLALSDFK